MSANRKHSTIWTHFTEDGNKRAICKYCKTSLSIAGGSQSNLMRHIRSKHPTTPITLERQVTAPIVLQNSGNDEPSTSAQIPYQPSQQSIASFLRKPPPIKKVEKIDKQVLKMIAKGHHALRLVEEPEFKKLIEEVSQCPGYTLPTRKTLSNNLLPAIHMEILENVKKDIR